MEPDKDRFSREAAHAILKLGFSKVDLARIDKLVELNGEGLLTVAERQELETYVRVGDLLSLLHLKAAKKLKSEDGGSDS